MRFVQSRTSFRIMLQGVAVALVLSLLVCPQGHAQAVDEVPVEIPMESYPSVREKDFSKSERSVVCSAVLAGLQPSQIQWQVDLSAACKVSNQGQLGSCWSNSGIEMMNVIYRKAGLILPQERLSTDYYTTMSMKLKALRALRNDKEITINTMNGNMLPFAAQLFLAAGIVLENDFSLPSKEIRLEAGGEIVQRSIRTSPYFRQSFNQELASAPKQQASVEAVLTKYLGRTDGVRTRPVPESLRAKLMPRFYTAVENEKNPVLNPAVESSYALIRTNFTTIDEKVRVALDAGFPVQIDLRHYSDSNLLMYSAATSFYEPILANPAETGNHAVFLKGYHLDANGKIDWYLLQNSWGDSFGEEGSASVSAQFIHNHVRLYSIPQSE